MRDEPQKPEGSIWTDEQWRAIHARGQDILVAAAAGSGKTAVLVERIIKRILHPDDPVDVDRLFVVTFTNAAAAEMKKRIGEALEKELKKNPNSLYLKRQRALLNRATISTLHAFCLDVIRQHYYQLNIDPKFRIADETEIALLQEEVLEELLESYYGRAQNNAFYELVDCFSSDRNDQEFQNLILTLYRYSRSHPFPSQWLDRIVERFTVGNQAYVQESAEALIDAVSRRAQQWLNSIERAMNISEKIGGPTPYIDNLLEDRQQVERILDACEQGWNELFHTFATHSFSRLKACRGDEYIPEYQEQVKAIRNLIKDECRMYAQTFFSRTLETHQEDVQRMGRHIALLIEVVKQFSFQYAEVKTSKALIDFSDLEHYCLQILMEEGSNEDMLIPSSVAIEYRDKFVELLVDEYQDTNMVQETILQLLTNRKTSPGNLFMVGDVKQSIYKFRMAEPGLFMSKYKQFDEANTETVQGLRIDLARNFRSRPEIIEGTNYLFKQIMDEQVGEVAYDRQAELRLGADFPSASHPVELIMLDQTSDKQTGVPQLVSTTNHTERNEERVNVEETDVDDLDSVQLEARYIAQRINRMLGAEESLQVYDKNINAYRPVQFKDIVILMRSTESSALQMVEQLKDQGIPAYADLTKGYFEASEVAIMMSLLKIIDNPYQDIPFVSVLRSAIVQLNEEELAQIRIQSPGEPFYTACQTFLETHEKEESKEEHAVLYEKLITFAHRYKRWRDRARKGSLAELIWEIYRDTGYYDYVGAMPGGKQRQANLRALYDRARQYEQTSFRGLFRFLRFIERMQDRGRDLGTARALGEQEDVVRIMTIHKSKGLEFPVVFLAGLAKRMNRRDLQQKVLLHKEQGLAVKMIDPVQRIMYPTLPYYALQQNLEQEMIAEEMRVLYVAFTRAKEKLVLVGTVKHAEKRVREWMQYAEHEAWLLPDSLRASAKDYLDWIGPALVRHRDCFDSFSEMAGGQSSLTVQNKEVADHSSSWKIERLAAHHFAGEFEIERQQDERMLNAIANLEQVPNRSQHQEEIERKLEWRYPYPHAETHMGKLSVTEIKRLKEYLSEGSQPPWTFQSSGSGGGVFERPRFMQERKLTEAEKGTILHTVMQHLPFEQPLSVADIEQEVEKLIKKELVTKEQVREIDWNLISAFYQSSLFSLIHEADEVYREIPFTYAANALDIYPDWNRQENERILIQGVIDCLCSHDGEWVIIDYKSDHIDPRLGRERLEQIMRQRYGLQLQLYASAVEEIWNFRITGIYLFFFDGGHVVPLERDSKASNLRNNLR